jgi:hypothetical protein
MSDNNERTSSAAVSNNATWVITDTNPITPSNINVNAICLMSSLNSSEVGALSTRNVLDNTNATAG